MSCAIYFSDSPHKSWSTQNVRYSWLIDQLVDRLRPEDEELRQTFRVSEEIHILALDSLREEDEFRWKRAIEVLSAVAADIVEGRLPPELKDEERTGLRAHYSELQLLLREHADEDPKNMRANQPPQRNAGSRPSSCDSPAS